MGASDESSPNRRRRDRGGRAGGRCGLGRGATRAGVVEVQPHEQQRQQAAGVRHSRGRDGARGGTAGDRQCQRRHEGVGHAGLRGLGDVRRRHAARRRVRRHAAAVRVQRLPDHRPGHAPEDRARTGGVRGGRRLRRPPADRSGERDERGRDGGRRPARSGEHVDERLRSGGLRRLPEQATSHCSSVDPARSSRRARTLRRLGRSAPCSSTKATPSRPTATASRP